MPNFFSYNKFSPLEVFLTLADTEVHGYDPECNCDFCLEDYFCRSCDWTISSCSCSVASSPSDYDYDFDDVEWQNICN